MKKGKDPIPAAFNAMLEKDRIRQQALAVNQNASLQDIGAILNESIFQVDEGYPDIARDLLLDMHSLIYPNASHLATAEENAALEMPCSNGECDPACNRCEENFDKPDQYQIHEDTIVELCHLEVGISNAFDVINHVSYLIGENQNEPGLFQSLLESAASLLERCNGDITKIRMKHVSACNGNEVTV